MSHHKLSFAFCLALFLTLSQSFLVAQDRGFAIKGTTEIGGTISYSSFTPVYAGRTGDALSIFTLGPQLGYFVSDGFEIGLSTGLSLLPGVSIISPSQGDNTTITQLFFSPSYNFQTSKGNIFPFLEAQLGYTSMASGGNSASGFSYGGRGGIKVVPVEHMILSFSVQYLAITLNPEGATERSGYNYLTVGVGISAYF